jgi:hypothetical protein
LSRSFAAVNRIGVEFGWDRRSLLLMASGDIYVQVTASQRSGGKSRSVIVLVPVLALQSSELTRHPNQLDEKTIAQKLAEPFAKYAFSHRRIFDDYEVSYAFFESEPHEIKGRLPQLTQVS